MNRLPYSTPFPPKRATRCRLPAEANRESGPPPANGRGMDGFVKARVESGVRALDAAWYNAPESFARERERIFASDWICVGRRDQLERRGDFFLAEVAGESLIVTRGKDGAVRAFYNVCRHRGTRLCTESAGRFGG